MGFKFLKALISAAATFGVGTIVTNAIKATTPAKMSIIKKIGVVVGGVVISGMVNQKVSEFVETKVDSTANEVKELFEKKQEV